MKGLFALHFNTCKRDLLIQLRQFHIVLKFLRMLVHLLFFPQVVWIVTQSVFIVWGAFLFLSTLLGCLRMLRADKGAPLRCLQQVSAGTYPVLTFTHTHIRSLW